jgi:hypothetical protein
VAQTPEIEKLQGATVPDYYFLKTEKAPENKPLVTHTDNLVSQQNFNENQDSPVNLQQFVRKAQSISGGFAENRQNGSGFPSFENSLPSDHFNFSFLSANASTQQKSPFQRQDQVPGYYFLKEPVKPLPQNFEGFDVNQIRKDFPVLHQTIHGKPLV